MVVALKENGIIYTSVKYGTFADFLSEIDDLEVEEQWTTSDARPGRDEEKWLNLILRKR